MKKISIIATAVFFAVLFITCSCSNISPAKPYTGTFYSDAALDGYVDQYTGYNNTSTLITIGDANTNAAMQGAVSFTLPAMKSVTSATLRIFLNDAVNTPFIDIAPGVLVSHITPNYTSGAAIPYLIYSGNTSMGQICGSMVSAWYELDVTAAVENDRINGRTNSQFRLYLNGLTDSNNDWDVVEFSSGDSSAASRPQLVISYTD